MTTATDSIQDSVNHMRDVAANDLVFAANRVEMKRTIDGLKDAELGSQFIPGSFEMAHDGLSFTAQVAEGFGYRYRSFRRGDFVTFNQQGEII